MKKIFLMLFSIFLLQSSFAQGIQFEPAERDWSALLNKAESNNQLIFVVAYSTSCHNCQDMQEKVYPSAEVGTIFNNQYINVKIDVDKATANDFALKYNILAYPTYLFINGKGEQVHRTMGTMTKEKFMEMGQNSIDPSHQFFPLKNRYLSGDRSAELLKSLTFMAKDLADHALLDSVHVAYLASQENWLSKENMDLALMCLKSVEQNTFSFLLKNKTAFIEIFGTAKINNLIEEVVLNSMSLYAYDYNKRDFDLSMAKAYGLQYLPADLFEQYWLLFNVNQHMRKKDNQAFFSTAIQYFDQYPCFNEFLYNNIALSFYESTKDEMYLNKAVSWALKAIAIKDVFQFNDTAAALYFKLGNKEKAQEYAQKAIEKGKESGYDTTETMSLLKKIESM